MAGINTLQEIYAKRGEEWTRNFLSSGLRVTEKAEAYRFSFELSKNGKLRFYGKNSEKPLNRIDRTVSDLYESAISKVEKLPEAIVLNLPKSHRFGFSWVPERGLTLTDITVRQYGKVIKQINENHIIAKWANLLHVKSGEELEGLIDGSVIESLMTSLKNGQQPIFESAPQKTFILKGDDGIAKIAPLCEREVREQKSQVFDLLMLQMYEHIQRLDFDRFVFRSERPDERYIELVSEAFNRFVEEKGSEFLEMGIKKPSFLEKSGKFNRRWVRNPKTLSILESHKDYEYLLGIFLVNLRKPKKPGGLLTESFVENFNQKIYTLEESVRNAEDSGFPEFNTILEKEEKEVDFREETGFSEDQAMRAVGMMQSYFAMPFMTTSEDEKPEVVHECNLLFMNMGEITNKVLAECERILKFSGKSFVLIHDSAAGRNCLWGMDPEQGDIVGKQLVKEYPHLFDCYESMKDPSLKKLLKAGGGRQIGDIYVGRSTNALVKEADTHNTISGKKYENSIFQIQSQEANAIRDCIEREDYKAFKGVFPQCTHSFWPQMQSSWQQKAYL
jgi:hypothetical protein